MQDSWSKYATVRGIQDLPEAPPRELVASACASPSSRTSTRTCTRSRPCWRTSTRAASTSSGVSATSSATGRGRTSALRSSQRAGDRLPGRAITISSCSGRSRSRRSPTTPAIAALWTQRALTTTRAVPGDARAAGGAPRRGALPRQPTRPGLGLRARREAPRAAAFAATERPLVLVGHSHVALELSSDGRELRGGQAAAGTRLDLGGPRRLLNPGSVGQPRDGDPRAAWLEIDTSDRLGDLPPHRLSGRADAGRDPRGGPPGDPRASGSRPASRLGCGARRRPARPAARPSCAKVMPSRASASWTSSRAL